MELASTLNTYETMEVFAISNLLDTPNIKNTEVGCILQMHMQILTHSLSSKPFVLADGTLQRWRQIF